MTHMHLMGIVSGSQFECDLAFLQQATGAQSLEAAIEQAVAREVNLLRHLASHRSVRILGRNEQGREVVYS
ncbi:MAG: hypothetical protein AABY18_04665 [Candidatus Thermoplasmatota archaeon]